MIDYSLIYRKSMCQARARTTTFTIVAATGALKSLFAQGLRITHSHEKDGVKTIEVNQGKTEHRFEGPTDVINEILDGLKYKE